MRSRGLSIVAGLAITETVSWGVLYYAFAIFLTPIKEARGWSTLAYAAHPKRVVPGAMLLAGNRYGQAVVRIVAVDDDGQVHFTILPGPVAKNRHLLGRSVA